MLRRRLFSTLKAGTWSTHAAIPRLPLPQLEDTLVGYLEALTPLVSPEALQRTRALADEFAANEGPRLQKALESLDAESPTSWVEGFWDAMYLEARSSMPLEWNPAFVLRPDPAGALSMAERAARFVFVATQLHVDIQRETYPPDYEGSVPLHMLQHAKLFGTARIPRYGRDAFPTFSKSKHVVVLSRRHVFSMRVLHDDGVTPVSAQQLQMNLLHIRSDHSTGPNVSLLTALPRDDWAGLRSELPSEFLRTIDEALFVVSLQDSLGDTLDEQAKEALLCSGGNRWYDKWQVIVDENGNASFNLEHSPYDGHTFVSMFNQMWPRLEASPLPKDSSTAREHSAYGVARLDPGPLSASLRDGVARGRELLQRTEHSLSLALLRYDWGTDKIKKQIRCSPDAFMQLAFQVAWLRLKGHVGSTYESGQVKRFLAGRTETIRPVTEESVRFARAFDSLRGHDGGRLRALFDAAAAKHVERVQVAKTGKGWDRHLFALKNLARHKQQRLPDHAYTMPGLFTDPSFAHYFNIEVSTSNSGALPFEAFAFMPVIPSGVGIGYQTFPNRIDVCATMHHQPASGFTNQLRSVIADMTHTFGEGNGAKKD